MGGTGSLGISGGFDQGAAGGAMTSAGDFEISGGVDRGLGISGRDVRGFVASAARGFEAGSGGFEISERAAGDAAVASIEILPPSAYLLMLLLQKFPVVSKHPVL